MASSWRYGKRSKYRAKVSHDPEDYYRLDPKKTLTQNSYEIYAALCNRKTRDTKRLFLLNALATLCQQHQQQQQQHLNDFGFSTEELLYCLSVCLVHTFAQVRAAALRTIRCALASPNDIKVFNSMQLQHLLCRSIDIYLKNDDERVQALKLIRKMLAISPADISPVVVRCLVSLADSPVDESDNLLRACLATLCEFAVLNPALLIVCGGVTSITRNILECHNPRIAESLCGVLLYLLEWPQTRNISGVRLDCLAAPYCDFTYRLGVMDKNKDAAREFRYTSCRLALLSILRSWTGTIEFCDPNKPSGLKAMVDALYLNQVEVRKAIMDLFYELLGLPQPMWTDDYAVAMQIVDPCDFQDAWLLSNGFVAMEGRCILPSLAARAPNVCEQHLALLLYCFLETGLLDALVEVVISTDVHISVRATVLIGKILQLMHTHLPSDICNTSSTLPALVAYATKGNPHARAAISALQDYQKMLHNRPSSCSLFLDSIIQGGSLIYTRLFRRDLNSQIIPPSNPPALGAGFVQNGTLERQRLDSVSSSEESQSSTSRRSSFRLKRKFLPFLENYRANKLIKDSHVLTVADSNAWDWEVVITILRSNLIRKLDDNTSKFLKVLVNFFKPSSNRFSHHDLTQGQPMPSYVLAGLDLIDWLLARYQLESMRLLTDLFYDISQQLKAVSTMNRAHDCLFSPQHMNNTMCQQYFLYIGRMCRMQKGISILTNTAVFEHLINLVRNTEHVCYVKLIVSGLDYTLMSVAHKVLERALTSSKTRGGRLYATQFLVVLMRARLPNFEVWGIPMILQQTKDPDRSVVLAAMDVLEEACHEKYYLEEIVSLWPNLKPLGDIGRILMSRYYSLSRGLNHSNARIKDEIEYWKNGYNKRYVLVVEADSHASLTLHVRNDDGYYSRRNCNTRPVIIPPNIPAHLYGQMVQTAQGTTALKKHGDLPHLIDVISSGKCSDESECLELKAAIWAVGHASTHSHGIEYFLDGGSKIYEKLVILATKCDVYSIRATCFHVLGLIGGTVAGANALVKLGWLSVRHDRNTTWPVHQIEDCISNNYTPVRHHFEDVPPYNYTSIDDHIDGLLTGSYWNLMLSGSSTTRDGGAASASSDAPDAANATIDSSKTGDDVSGKQMVTPSAKSKTLPEGTASRFGKHQRSLSESKTTDVLSMLGGGSAVVGSHYQHRVRYNSCTDSNTSGVSSCESVTGRAGAVGSDFQQFPLSPIPSMSNLLETPPKAPLLRRTSLIGTSYLQNAISPADIRGYAQLRSLRRHCRPVLSESAADFYDIIDGSKAVGGSGVGGVKSSFSDAERRMKVRSLDRNTLKFDLIDWPVKYPLATPTVPKFFSQNDSLGPCYAGISLPKNLLDLFPRRNFAVTYVSRDIQDQDVTGINLLTAKQQLLIDSLNNEAGDESSVISSLSDVSSVSKRSKWIGAKHGRQNCLYCSRPRRNHTQTYHLDSDVILNELYATAAGGALPATSTKLTSAKRHANAQTSSTIQLSDISFNSPESILSEESMPDRLTATILYNVQRLANPVSAKQSKMALLELRQKHPTTFQDMCLYSEVCRTLGRSRYRMTARRFLQELFLDLNFDTFYVEPTEILAKKEKEFALQEKENLTTMAGEKRQSGDGHVLQAIQQAHHHHHTHQLQHSTVPLSSGSGGGGGGAGGVASGSGVGLSYVGASHKPHLKSQPLASVYETSCENLLMEQSPRQDPQKKMKRSKLASLDLDQKSPQDDVYREELFIHSDGDGDEDIADPDDRDEIDGMSNLQNLSATTMSSTVTCASTSQSQSQSRCSFTTPFCNSNCSSVCTISHQPTQANGAGGNATTTPTTPIENENKVYTRGRFYTLELDLSCTKNKFPIRHRNQGTTKTASATATDPVVQSTATTATTAMAPSLKRQLSLGTSSDMSPAMASVSSSASKSTYRCPVVPLAYTQYYSQYGEGGTVKLTITKSLAASLAKPIGSLYCEKRLQSCKSEAVLPNMATTNTTTTTTAAVAKAKGAIDGELEAAIATVTTAVSAMATTNASQMQT